MYSRYDHINRPFPTWVEGGVKVLGNMNVSLTITAKTSIPVDTYTGVVSVDDIEYRPGSCMVTHPGIICYESLLR